MSKLTLPAAILAGLAASRLTRLIQEDTLTEPLRQKLNEYLPAPGAIITPNVTKWVREWNAERSEWFLRPEFSQRPAPLSDRWSPVYTEQGALGYWTAPEGTKIGQGLGCPMCLGVWASAAILVARRVPVLRQLADVMAVAAIALAWHEHRDKL